MTKTCQPHSESEDSLKGVCKGEDCKLALVTPILSGRISRNSSKKLPEACERTLKRFDPSLNVCSQDFDII